MSGNRFKPCETALALVVMIAGLAWLAYAGGVL
jgi:hypothetical protein